MNGHLPEDPNPLKRLDLAVGYLLPVCQQRGQHHKQQQDTSFIPSHKHLFFSMPLFQSTILPIIGNPLIRYTNLSYQFNSCHPTTPPLLPSNLHTSF
jgi:hypothetical protein